jgi:hypothetical protein
MPKSRRAITVILFGLLFFVGIFCGIRYSRWSASRSPSRMYDTATLLKEVQTLSQLVTVKYVMEKAEPWNDPPQNILSLFAGDNHILLLAHGIVKAGVDLGEIKPGDLQVKEKIVYLKLPAARVTDAYLDDSETKVIERSSGFLRAFNKDLEQNIRRDAVEDIRLAALRGGIRRDADERAQTLLTNLFHQLGFEKVEFVSRATD